MLSLDRVSIRRGGRSVLRELSLNARPGRILALVGPNGAGKTTALDILSGDLKPDEGRALLSGRSIRELNATEKALRRAVMPQHFELVFAFTAFEIVEMGVLPHVRPAERVDIAAEAMAHAGVSDFAERYVPRLSGGERQRVALARALAQILSADRHIDEGRDRFLLLDEPTASLDLAHQVEVMRTARRVADAGVGIVAILHDLNLAAGFTDDLAILSQGRLEAYGPPAEILSEETIETVYGARVRVLEQDGIPTISLRTF